MKQGNLKRWVSLEDADIPPIIKKGYEDNVLHRDIWGRSEPADPLSRKALPSAAPLAPDINEDAYLVRCATNERIDLYKDDFIIGKGREADYKIEGNAAISRKHIRIQKNGEMYLLEDMGSLNHTYVDDVMINDVVELNSGQLIKLADEAFAFFVEKVEK